MSLLRTIWHGFERVAFAIGEVISTVVLVAFYYTIFALVAIPFRLFARDPMAAQGPSSNWAPKIRTASTLEDFSSE